jgi:hypothetical protein
MMKILLTGDFSKAVLKDIGAIDGSLYNPADLDTIWESMVNGIFYSPKSLPAERWIDNTGNPLATQCEKRDSDDAQLKALRKALQSFKKPESIPFSLPSNLIRYVTMPGDLPRKIKLGPFESEDWTPFCFFANPIFDFDRAGVSVEYLQDLCIEHGTKTKLPERDVRVTKYAHAHEKELVRTQVESKMQYYGHPLKESGFAVLLPPPNFVGSDGRQNKTGMHALLFGTKEYKKFSRTLAKARMRRANSVRNSEDAIKHAKFMQQDYSTWPFSVQEIYADEAYKMSLNSREEKALEIYSNMISKYQEFIERNMKNMLRANPSQFQMSMKPLKSPGTDVILPDGSLYKKTDHWYLPHEAFDTGHNDRNAYAKFTYKPLKEALLPVIVPSERKRMEGLIAGKLHDPQWEFEMVMLGCSREGVIAWRINQPDEQKYCVVKNKGPVWEVDLTDKDDLPSWDNDDEWRKFQGKPRELCAHPDFGTYYSLKISPYQVACAIKEQMDLQPDSYKWVTVKGKKRRRYQFDKATTLLRARIICPHKWRFNMFDGTIAKFYAIPMEHCRCGFPNMKVGSLYEQNYRHAVRMNNVVPWAFDVSHYETFSSANEDIMLKIFGNNNPRRKLYFEDAASGWIASPLGRRYHGFQTSSGIGHTTHFSLVPGTFLTGVDVAYRGETSEFFEVCTAAWTKLLWEAVAYAKEEFGLDDPNPFGDTPPPFPVYHTRGHAVESLIGYGSDDQGGWDQSDEASTDEITQAILSKDAEDWRQRCRCSAELGESAHFGIVRTTTGFQADETSSDWKWCFSERKSVGDLIALGATVAFEATPGLEEDVQEALDAIGGGSTEAYWVGAQIASSVINGNPEYFSQLLAANYPKESPSGRRMSEALEAKHFKLDDSNKLPIEVTTEIVDLYLDFIQSKF